MFAAVKAKGVTHIYNAAKEPEIVNVASFYVRWALKFMVLELVR